MSLKNPDLEAALIARLLIQPDQVPLINLVDDDFSDRQWRSAYGAMREMAAEHRVIDVASLRSRLPALDTRYLLSEISPAHRATAEEYAGIISDMAARRRLVGSLETVIAKAEHGTMATALTDVSTALTSALAGSSDGGVLSPDSAVARYLDARGRGRKGLRWAPHVLNDYIQPIQGGELAVVGARPSVGKTVIAEQIVDAWAAESGKPVLFASLEMSVYKLLDRALLRQGVARGVMGDSTDDILAARRRVGVWYLDDPRATTGAVRAAAAKVNILGNGLGGVAVDYIGLLRDAGDNEVQRIGRISAELKALAREFDVPVLALTQLNRSSVREGRLPRLDDIRDSGNVEQDADIVLGLDRIIGQPDSQLVVLKNRDGAAGMVVNLHFDERRLELR